MGPEGWAILLTKILDARDGNGPERYPVDVVKLALDIPPSGSRRPPLNGSMRMILMDSKVHWFQERNAQRPGVYSITTTNDLNGRALPSPMNLATTFFIGKNTPMGFGAART